jgi:hypothetical protein
MAIEGDTGNGATVTFATPTFSASIDPISITPGAFQNAAIDASTLATEGIMEMLPSDLASVAPSSATFKWVAGSGMPSFPSEAGTITITMPSDIGTSLAGTGFITSYTPPTMENGVLMVGQIEWQYDGDTGPSLS